MSPLTIFVIVLVLVWGGIALILRSETRKAGGLKPWLADLATTNFRIFVSIVLAVFYVVITMLITVLAVTNPLEVRELPDVVLDTIGLFLIGMMGIDAASYIAKRITHRPGGGGDVPPGSTQQMPVPGSTTVKTEGGASVTVVPPTPPPMESQ